MKKLFLAILLLPLTAAFAWDGIEPSTGKKIEITSKKSKVKKGNTIEIFDHGTDQYHEVEIDRMASEGKYIRFEVYDKDTGQERTFLMEGFTKKAQQQ